jgi:hypothetical protein
MTSLHNLERRIAKLETKPAGDEPLIIEYVVVVPGVFDEDGKLKQTLLSRHTPGKEVEYF